MHVKRSLLLFVLLIFFPAVCLAGIPQQLAENFKSLSGVIIMPIGDEYLIDLDQSQGVAEGDIFSVIAPGEPVVHPVSGKILGNLDQVLGWLQVTRVKSGYSYARPVGKEVKFSKGALIRRNENIPALFWDYSGNGEGTFAELRAALPNLDWLDYAAAQKLRAEQPEALPDKNPKLYFIYHTGQLEVRGTDFQMLSQFALGGTAISATAPLPSAAPTVSVPAPVGSTGIIMTEAKQPETGGIVYNQIQDNANIWSAKEWQDNPTGIEINDFDGDGNHEIAVLFKDHLEIGRVVNRTYQLVFTVSLPSVSKALNLSSADLDGNGLPELFVSAVNGLEVNSLIIAEKNGSYQVVQNHLPWFLHAIQEPGGTKVVLGQKLGQKAYIFAPEVVRLAFLNGKYQSAGEYPHPWSTDIFSLQPFTDQHGQQFFAEINSSDNLRVFDHASEKLWESSKNYGGSVVAFPRDDSTGGPDFATTFVHIKPRLALLDNSTVLAPLNEGWRLSDSLQSIGPGQVVALRWDGSSMTELWHSKPESGSLVDFQYADIDNDQQPELIELIYFSRAGLLTKGRAGLRVFELN